MKEAFDLFDTDATNTIDVKEVRVALRALGFKLSRDEVQKLLVEAGKEKATKLEFDDFCKVIASTMLSRDPREEMELAFSYFAADGEQEGSVIDINKLRKMAKELGENMDEDELEEMISEADVNGDGLIDINEFMRVMQKTSMF